MALVKNSVMALVKHRVMALVFLPEV